MYSPVPTRGPVTRFEWWFAGLFLVVILGLFVADIIHDYTPVKLSALLVVLFWIPLLALHEAGHALVAWLLGWRVVMIVIGMGRVLGSFRIGTAQVEVRIAPVEGFVRCYPTNLFLPGLKNALIFLAGPGVELLLAWIILVVIGPDQLLAPTDDYSIIFWQSLAAAATSQAVINLIPMATATHEGEVVSDGLGFIRSLFTSSERYAEMLARLDEAELEAGREG
ncbi:MAG: M50 family metallopeptidase [Gemmatales bacterium]